MSGEDVRMRGFRGRAELGEALELLRSTAIALPAESVPVTACAGRMLATTIHAPIDVPGFRRAAVDGYAIRGEDSFAASEHNPITLEVLGTSLPGRPCAATLHEGQAVRITTGAPLPTGADAVLQAELTRAQHRGGREWVELLGTVAPLRHIGEVGEDLARGRPVLPAGRRLRPQDAAVLASLGLADLPVHRRPRLQLLVTGDELVPPGTRPGPWQIVDSNSVLLAALAARDGADNLPTLHSRDGEPALTAAFLNMCEGTADVLLVAGATSVGLEDLMPQVLARIGTLELHGLAVRPASPTGIGRLHDGRRVFLLPGNPVSCLCAFELLVGPWLRALGGRPHPWTFPHPARTLPLARKLSSKVGRVDFVRMRIVADQAEPVATSGASNLSSTVLADGFTLVPADSEGAAPGDPVTVYLFDDPGGES
jgi:molybdopterin molybdotransferase